MTILIVCDVLGEENNGTTIAAMNLIRYLRAAGHDVRLLCADRDKRGEAGVYVVPNLSFGRLLDAYVAKVGVTLAKADEDIILEALSGVEHIHIMLPFALGIKTAQLAKERGLPMTAGFHMQAENLTSYIKLNGIGIANHAVYRFIYKHLYQYVDAIHYPSSFIRDVFERHIKRKTNGYVISNGVNDYVMPKDSERPSEFADRIVILTTGRYAREKSQDTLIRAVKLSRHKDRIQLILGGQGVKERSYRKLAAGLPIEPIFKFYSRDEIIDVLNYSDIYVHPAEVELEGIACLEAVACGKLTIVSNSPRAATRGFAVDEKCIFENRNPRSLAKVIDYWIEHPDERREYEMRYLESAVVLRQDECMRAMEAMMLEVANGKKKD